MDKERRTKIATALHQYRETVSHHSFFLLRILVECIEAQPPPPHCSASTAQRVCLQEFHQYLRGAVPESVKSPRDLLNNNVRAELTRRASLDGVSHFPVNLEQREEYFATLRTYIAEINVEAARFPPADLEYLCTLVSGISGPGLPYNRESQQIDFVSSINNHELKDMVEDVTVPVRDYEGGGYNKITYSWEDWEIAIAVKIGGGNISNGGSYALYCRNEDNKQWMWRYGIYDEDWYSDVFDSVKEFLGFYAHFREQTEEEVRKDI